MAPFSKPETVLKQAEGLVSVGQTHAALQSLTEMFSSKRFRSTPLASLEPIMLRFVELCVDMRKGRTAKEGLMQYKNIAQNTSVQSIEVVITRFVALADGKVRAAQEKAAVQAAAVDVDDLEASETPESILLGAVSGDQNKDRTDRALVTPWLKFLWESYRTALETLKNNARLEVIYQTIAQQAFKFCLTHNRKVEFRRLCETLRLHLANVAKYAHQPHSINLADADTLQHHLDTRFAQLNTSVELELWQEAFRSVEDVHNLLTMAKKAPRPAMMAGYYEKLTRIFLMSGNALYHAAAWGRYWQMVCANNGANGKSPEELQRLAGQVLISALAVPVSAAPSSTSTSSNSPDARLTALLGLATPPTRGSLLAFCAPHSSSASSILPPNTNAAHQSILQLAPSAIQQLYTILEVSFDPLSLCASVAPLLSSLRLSEEWKVYVPLLERAVLSRLMAQLAQVYESVGVGFVGGLVEPLRVAAEAAAAAAATANGDAAAPTEGEDKTAPTSAKSPFSAPQIESYIMGCARRGELAVRVDHAAGVIVFVDEGFRGVVGDDSAASSSSNVLNANGEYGGRGSETPIQPSVAELVRTRLGSVARCLHASVGVIGAAAPAGETRTTEEQNEQFKTLVAAVHAERKSLLLRRALVARRRELLSELSVRREKEEAVRRADASRREKEEEEKRKKEEVRRRELVRVEKIKEDMKAQDAERYKAALVEKGILKVGEAKNIAALDTEGLIGMQVAQLEKEKKELSERLRIVAKRVDHVERAFRKEERALLAVDYEAQQAGDRLTFASVQRARTEAAKRAHEEDVETKARLGRMVGEYEKRRGEVLKRRGEEYAKRREAATRKIEEEKGKRRKAVLTQREAERKAEEEARRLEREREEEERRIEEERAAEEERIRAEEEAAVAAAEAAKLEAEQKALEQRKQREAERAEAMEKARLQAQREEEAMRRASEKAAPPMRKPIVPAPPSGIRAPVAAPAAANGEGTGVWRRGAGAASGGTPTGSVPVTPTRASGLGSTPPRAESPSPAVAKYTPGALRGAAPGGGWRAAAARNTATAGAAPVPARAASPAPATPTPSVPSSPMKAEAPGKDDDGFQTVPEKKGVWRPRRGRA